MSRQPFWLIECLDREEDRYGLAERPSSGEMVILWVPVPDDVIEAELGRA